MTWGSESGDEHQEKESANGVLFLGMEFGVCLGYEEKHVLHSCTQGVL
jgi:hypothetical protein